MTDTSRTRSTPFTPARIAAVLLAALAVMFVVQNRTMTAITVFWIQVQAPLWFTLLTLFVIGWLVGVLVSRRRAAA